MAVKMKSLWMFLLFTLLFVLQATVSFAQEASFGPSEEQRRKSFYEHKAENREADIERERGLQEFLREEAAWELKRQKDLKADQKRKKEEAPGEDSPEYKADLKRRLADYEELERYREKYVQKKKTFEAKDAKEKAKRDAWAMEEYGLDQKRPRYDLARRALFGGKPLGSSGRGGGSTFGGSSGGGSYTPPNPGGQTFPEPQYPEFDGYVPPPPMPDPGGYFPPPDGGFPQPTFPGGDDGGFYPPPPPPPPEGFGNNF